jgi:hypothetical protein
VSCGRECQFLCLEICASRRFASWVAWCFVVGFGALPGDKTYILRLGPFGLGQELVSKRALFILLDESWLFLVLLRGDVPGRPCACGRRGRRTPWVTDASGRAAQVHSPRGSGRRPCWLCQPYPPHSQYSCDPMVSSVGSRCFVPQTELPVSGAVQVPVAERLGPAHHPGALHDELSKGGLRHDCGNVCGGDGGRR